jgi:hypothetical protein
MMTLAAIDAISALIGQTTHAHRRFDLVIELLGELRMTLIDERRQPNDQELEIAQQAIICAEWGYLRYPTVVTSLCDARLLIARARVDEAEPLKALSSAISRVTRVHEGTGPCPPIETVAR